MIRVSLTRKSFYYVRPYHLFYIGSDVWDLGTEGQRNVVVIKNDSTGVKHLFFYARKHFGNLYRENGPDSINTQKYLQYIPMIATHKDDNGAPVFLNVYFPV